MPGASPDGVHLDLLPPGSKVGEAWSHTMISSLWGGWDSDLQVKFPLLYKSVQCAGFEEEWEENINN